MIYETPQHKRNKVHLLNADAWPALSAYIDEHCSSDLSAESMCVCDPPADLSAYLADRELPFSRRLLKLIRESGSDEVEIYKRAHVDRKLFSKIRSDPNYRPGKMTVIAFTLALHLSLSETQKLLASAGFSLSGSAHFDLIIRYFVERGEYDLFVINDALYAFDQPILMM